MRFSLPLLSAFLLPLLSVAAPTLIPSPALAARAAITSPSSAYVPPTRRSDKYKPSLDLPTPTCTPGNEEYATPGKDGYAPPEACNSFWPYFPHFATAIAFSIMFGILTLAHLVQAVVHRNGFCWVIIMASLWETGAYILRALGSKNQQSSGIATVAQILILVGPLWVNAFAYMVFARTVHFYSPTRKVWVFSPSVLALIFVTLDIAAFVIQLVGGGMAGPGSSPKQQRKGLDIYLGGIGMQEGFIVLFLFLAIKFHRDQLLAEKVGRLTADKMDGWRWLIWTLYGCLLAISIRIVYRLAEFSGGLGAENPLPSNEPVLYVLESMPMWLAILAWNVVHPGRFIQGEGAKMPPSIVSRTFRRLCCCACCCSCCRQKRHNRLADNSELEDSQELNPAPKQHRGRVSANPVNPFLDDQSREPSPNGNASVRLRPPPAADNPRDISPEPFSYTAYRPREFSS